MVKFTTILVVAPEKPLLTMKDPKQSAWSTAATAQELLDEHSPVPFSG